MEHTLKIQTGLALRVADHSERELIRASTLHGKGNVSLEQQACEPGAPRNRLRHDLSKMKLEKMAREALGRQPRPSQNKEKKTRERVEGTQSSKEVAEVLHRRAHST